jgi:hypothetical protein
VYVSSIEPVYGGGALYPSRCPSQNQSALLHFSALMPAQPQSADAYASIRNIFIRNVGYTSNGRFGPKAVIRPLRFTPSSTE